MWFVGGAPIHPLHQLREHGVGDEGGFGGFLVKIIQRVGHERHQGAFLLGQALYDAMNLRLDHVLNQFVEQRVFLLHLPLPMIPEVPFGGAVVLPLRRRNASKPFELSVASRSARSFMAPTRCQSTDSEQHEGQCSGFGHGIE